MAGIGKYAKGKKFTLKSGNSPAFKMMGEAMPGDSPITKSPYEMNNFGVGKGISPYKEVDYEKMQKESAKKDPRYGKMSLEEYTAEVKRQMESKEKTGSYDAMGAYDAKGDKKDKNTTGDTSSDTGDAASNQEDQGDQGDPNTQVPTEKGGRFKQGLKRAAGIGIAALTGGLDAAYGSGKILPSNASIIRRKYDKEAQGLTPEERIAQIEAQSNKK